MRPTPGIRRMVLCVLLCGFAPGWAGCLFGFRRERPAPEAVLPPPGVGPADGVELAVYFITLPAGRAPARFAREFWTKADEGVMAPDVAALWRANGLHVGRVGQAALDRAEALHRAGPKSGAGVALRRLRVPHRGRTVLAASLPQPQRTFLLTLPGRRTIARTFSGVSVTLEAVCRVVDEETSYLELVPRLLGPGRREVEPGLLDFLTTEVALGRNQGLVVGVGSGVRQTVGQRLLTSRRGLEREERLIVVSAEPVCLKGGERERR